MFKIAALYHFVNINDPEAIQIKLIETCKKYNIQGTLILAHEGINGTVAGETDSLDQFIYHLQSDERFKTLELKFSSASKRPFKRMKVHIKKEIVTLGQGNLDPAKNAGTYVYPEHWNTLITDPEVILIDTRNNYEVNIGTFKGAINPNTNNFKEFPDFVEKNLDPKLHKKIAMFCTGGIRCEKSTALLKKAGFESVYHLKGGILGYLEKTKEEDSLWQGECFVFDERTAVSHGLKESGYTFCRGCRNPLSPSDTTHPQYLSNIHCHHCYPFLTEKKLKSSQERQRQINLATLKTKKNTPDSHDHATCT